MSKSKDASAARSVLEYLNRQNRPYSAVDIFNNLHKEYGKTAVVKACESLTEGGKIKEKVYGKQKVYVADQGQFPDVDDNEIRDMDTRIGELSTQNQEMDVQVKRLDAELRGLNSSVSTEEAVLQLKRLTDECEACKGKLKTLKEGGKTVSPEEKDRIYTARTKYVKEWRKRKRISNDILGAILEGYPKTKKQLYEEVGLETDEDYGTSPPDI
ncbi:homologous-pairing protein 2 homolog [Saccostrea echinata]|uniref:homologous-pairing protein 2 homolog n=1 Tax=Saccostrea echinata TaxID=191078 RepID=UPI002A828E8B|nr:homologous-pairing protein 2 homolog [Saccostrea echinata]